MQHFDGARLSPNSVRNAVWHALNEPVCQYLRNRNQRCSTVYIDNSLGSLARDSPVYNIIMACLISWETYILNSVALCWWRAVLRRRFVQWYFDHWVGYSLFLLHNCIIFQLSSRIRFSLFCQWCLRGVGFLGGVLRSSNYGFCCEKLVNFP